MSGEPVLQHHHVDVFVGEERRYVRGLVLRKMAPGWQIYDDLGLAGEREKVFGEGLTLEEGLVKALSILHSILGPPLYPVWGTAPYELAGYERPRSRFWPPWRLGKGALSEIRVGKDGRPERLRSPGNWR